MNEGNVEAQGTHTELLANCPLYESLWRAYNSARDTGEEEKQ